MTGRAGTVAALTVVAVLLAAVGLAACGEGSSNTTSSGGATSPGESATTPASSPEAVWAKEVRGVMSYFENHVSAQVLPTIQDTYNQRLLEPLYRTYGADLGTLANKLAATKPPAACAATQKKIADAAKQVAQLTTELGEQSNLSQQKYALLLERQGEKIHVSSVELTELTAKPHC